MFHPRTPRPGDWMIYRKTKHGVRPGPRARCIDPEPLGDGYTYVVDKFWVVIGPTGDGRLLLRTRRGKTRLMDPDDPDLRPAHWWERLLYRQRFEPVSPAATSSATPAS